MRTTGTRLRENVNIAKKIKLVMQITMPIFWFTLNLLVPGRDNWKKKKEGNGPWGH